MGKAINIAGGTLTAKDHAVINHCIKDNSIGIGAGFGNEMAHRLDSVNELTILDGFAMIQGRCYVIYPGDEETLIIRSGSQGMKRHDLVVLEFDNALEKLELKVLEGVESSDPTDPEIIQDDTLGGGNLYQMPLYRVLVDGLNVEVEDIREYMGGAVGKNIDLAVTTFNTPNLSFMVEEGARPKTIKFTNDVKLEGGGGVELIWTNAVSTGSQEYPIDLSNYETILVETLGTGGEGADTYRSRCLNILKVIKGTPDPKKDSQRLSYYQWTYASYGGTNTTQALNVFAEVDNTGIHLHSRSGQNVCISRIYNVPGVILE